MPSQVRMESQHDRSAWWFASAALGIAISAFLFAGWLPLAFSIVTVFLFAGPHNWLEARYMMTRMPARWGKLRSYFLVGLLGVPVLAGMSAALPYGMQAWRATSETWLFGVATWNTLLVLWITTLVHMRSQQNPRRNWQWVWPIGFLLIALNWLCPLAWSMGLIYLHPVVALWFLDREITKRYPTWKLSYRVSLAVVPLMLAALWWRLSGSPDLPEPDLLTMQITNHAGGMIFENISTHCLVATHTFLEMLHYGVWILAIPLVSGAASWNLQNVPLSRRSRGWRGVIAFILGLGLFISLILWVGFLVNYPLTRDVYFTVAILHVLAEVPFLLRLL